MPAFQRLATISEADEANMTNNSLNRYSMPVTRSRSYISELNIDSSIDSNNTAGFLFGDEDSGNGEKSYQAANQTDVYPSIRNSAYGNMVSSFGSCLPYPCKLKLLRHVYRTTFPSFRSPAMPTVNAFLYCFVVIPASLKTP